MHANNTLRDIRRTNDSYVHTGRIGVDTSLSIVVKSPAEQHTPITATTTCPLLTSPVHFCPPPMADKHN